MLYKNFQVTVKAEAIKDFMVTLGVKANTPYDVVGISGNMLLVRVGENLVEFYPRNVLFYQ